MSVMGHQGNMEYSAMPSLYSVRADRRPLFQRRRLHSALGCPLVGKSPLTLVPNYCSACDNDGMPKPGVFLSHTWKDKPFVRKPASDLAYSWDGFSNAALFLTSWLLFHHRWPPTTQVHPRTIATRAASESRIICSERLLEAVNSTVDRKAKFMSSNDTGQSRIGIARVTESVFPLTRFLVPRPDGVAAEL